ncbi:MAG: putative lipid II flippase FtsW [Oligoflexales bacterium]
MLIVTVLTCIGLIMIYSSSAIPAYQKFSDSFYFFKKQAIVAAFGFACIGLIFFIPFRLVELATIPLLAFSAILLALTLHPQMGADANGAARWVKLGFLKFQPTELAKLALVLFLSKNLTRPSADINRFWTGIFPNLLVLGILTALLICQPDFGSSFLLFVVTFLMLFSAGLDKKYIFGGLLLGLSGFIVAVMNAPYRLKRLTSFMDPWGTVQEGGFQIIQSYLGFQNGGVFGLGLGESRQKLYFLPEAHTDFILSVVGEELGLIGVMLVIFCFGYLTFLGFKIAKIQIAKHKAYLALGLTLTISMQAAINIGVTMGLLPTKGIPLPFVSSGASSLLVFLVISGLLIRLGKQTSA